MKPLALALLVIGCQQAPLTVVGRNELAGVEGRIDHCAWDAKGERLFVAALGNGSVEVVAWPASDPASGKVTGRLQHLSEPQGIVYLPESDELVFTTGGDGKLHVHDAATLAAKKSFVVGGDADNVRVDAKSGLLYVGCEEGLAIVDPKKWERVATIALAGHAESFQLEPGADGAAARIFVNVPAAKHVAVVDAKARKVVATWELGDAASNFPMALDAKGARLFVGCRAPPCVVVLDTATGRRVTTLPIGGDCDDLFLDPERGHVLASCGSGVVTLLAMKSGGPADAPDSFAPLADVPTAAGARTSLFVPARRALFVAVPKRDGQRCEIRLLEAR